MDCLTCVFTNMFEADTCLRHSNVHCLTCALPVCALSNALPVCAERSHASSLLIMALFLTARQTSAKVPDLLVVAVSATDIAMVCVLQTYGPHTPTYAADICRSHTPTYSTHSYICLQPLAHTPTYVCSISMSVASSTHSCMVCVLQTYVFISLAHRHGFSLTLLRTCTRTTHQCGHTRTRHHDRQAHSGASGGGLQDQQSKLHTGQPPHTSQNEDRAQVAGWVVARRRSSAAAHWSMQGGHTMQGGMQGGQTMQGVHTTSKQGTSLEDCLEACLEACHSSEGVQQYQDEEALQQYNEDEEALQDYNETSALEQYSDEDAATSLHAPPRSHLAQPRVPSSLVAEMHNPHVLTHRVAHINSRRVVRIDCLAQSAPPHMPCLPPHRSPSPSRGPPHQPQPLNTPTPYQPLNTPTPYECQGNGMGACRSPAGRGVEGDEEVWMEANGIERSLQPLHTADPHLDRTDGVCGTDEAWTAEVLAQAWAGMPQGHSR